MERVCSVCGVTNGKGVCVGGGVSKGQVSSYPILSEGLTEYTYARTVHTVCTRTYMYTYPWTQA